MDGILIIDKPVDWTSHDVVGKLRKILKTKRIGHTGTLDPFATGVLVLLIGKATRLAQFLDKDVKEYEALVQFGFETDTGDLTGTQRNSVVIREDDLKSKIRNLDAALANFRGQIEQIPPMYSAKKIAGKKLYELARQGIEIERKPVNVTIYELERVENAAVRNPESQICLRVACSAGTYIRTLAEDIGRSLGVGAHLAGLRRIRAGKFDLEKSVTLEQLEELVVENKLEDVLISMNKALDHLPEIKLSAPEVRRIQNGIGLAWASSETKDDQVFRMTDEHSNLAAIGFYNAEKKAIQPRLVLT